MWSKDREADTDVANMADVADIDSERKRTWANLTQLELAADATLSNKLLYKPALRFHGLTGGLWGPPSGALSTTNSDSRPPSYHVRDPIGPEYSEAGSTYDSLYKAGRLSPVALRRRNALVIVLVAFALLAVVAAAVGIVIYLRHPSAMLRANVSFVIANRNYSHSLHNRSSTDFLELEAPLCSEMEHYFLSSGLSHFYMSCDVVSLRAGSAEDGSPGSGVAAHLTLDFQENALTNDAGRIKRVILQKAGRHRSASTLYLVLDDLLVYLRSLRVQLQTLPLDEEFEPRVPWRNDVDFIDRLMKSNNFSDIAGMTDVLRELVKSVSNMTSKLNIMHDVINYINTTLHDQNKPITSLVYTLGNITVSLDNLSKNLDDINSTLKKFKTFLKGLNSNMFKIDDIVDHLDDAIANLDNSALFLNSSIFDVNATINGMTGAMINVDGSLKHINQSVIDFNGTSLFTDQTLHSLNKTLHSLEDSLARMNRKIEHIAGGLTGINVTLNTLNDTVQNSKDRLKNLHGKLHSINETLLNISSTVKVLTRTYTKINDTLSRKNESLQFINGTVLEVIGELIDMHIILKNLTYIVDNTDEKMVLMNDTLSESLKWIRGMVTTISKLNVSHTHDNSTIHISLKDNSLLDTVNLLLRMNSTLFGLKHDVHGINSNLDDTDVKINNLDHTLKQLAHTLGFINATFIVLNDTIDLMNTTVYDVNKSLDAMKSIFDDMDGSTKQINVTFGYINPMLVKANNSINDILESVMNANATLNHVGEALDNINATSDYLMQSIGSTQDYIRNFNGTLPILNSKLYNANQSVTLVNGKINIVTNSFGLLQSTLTDLDGKIIVLFDKLQDTNNTLSKVNHSFVIFNSSMSWMEESIDELSNRIKDIFDSYRKMKRSFTGMDKAFPNIKSELEQLNTSIDILNATINTKTANAAEKKTKRDTLLTKYEIIQKAYEVVRKNAYNLKEAVKLMKHNATTTNITLARLVDKANYVNNELALMARKVNYAKRVVPMINGKYKLLNKTSNEVSKKVDIVDDLLEAIVRGMTYYISKAESFPNLRIPVIQMENDIRDIEKDFQGNATLFRNWLLKFNASKNIVWNKNHNLHGINETVGAFTQRFEDVNNTLVNFEAIIGSTSDATSSTHAFIRDIKLTFRTINETMANIRHINTNNNETDEKLSLLNKTITWRAKYVDQLVSRLEAVNGIFKNITDKYGFIVGNYNATLKFNLINSSTEHLGDILLNLQNNLDNVLDVFENTVSNYTTTRISYTGSDIELNDESKDLLEKMINAHLNATHSFTDITNTMKMLLEISTNANASLTQTEAHIDDVERHILKHNYIRSQHPILEDRFDIAQISFDNITADLANTTYKIQHLVNIGAIIHDQISSIPNTNLSVSNELNDLAEDLEELYLLADAITELKENFQQNYTYFKSMNTSRFPMSVIRKYYKTYQEGIAYANLSLENIENELISKNKAADDVQKRFTLLKQALDSYGQNENDLARIDSAIMHMKDNVTNLISSYNIVFDALSNIRLQLEAIEGNYTNFSTTYVDFSESYVHEAIYEMVDTFSDLLIQIDKIFHMSNQTSEDFLQTNSTFRNSVLDEYNVIPIMTQVTNEISELEDNVAIIEKSTKKILSQIKTVNSSLSGVNETIHLTNETLFVDRQKELLANRTFPLLMQQQTQVGDTIRKTEKMINESRTGLLKVNKLFQYVKNRIDNFHGINISMDDFGRMLNNFKNNISRMDEDLEQIESIFHESDEFLWTENGTRYSSNATLNEIKQRYENVDHMMDQLSHQLLGMHTIMRQEAKSYSNLTNSLSELNMSLDAFLNSKNRVSDMIEQMQNINNKSKESILQMDKIKNAITNLESDTQNIKLSHSHINETFLNNFTNSFESKLGATLDEYADTLKTLVNTIEFIDEADAIARHINSSINGFIDTPKKLNTLISSEIDAFNDFHRLISSLTDNLTNTKGNITSLSKKLIALNSAFSDMKDEFMRKEKEDFYNKHFPLLLNKYNQTSQVLNSSRNTIKSLFNQTRRLHNDMIHLVKRIQYSDVVNISTAYIESELTDSNQTVNASDVLLSILLDTLKQAKSLFAADNGKYIGENETLANLHNRYRKLNKTVLQANEVLLVTNTSLQQTNKTLVAIGGSIFGIHHSVNGLDATNISLVNITRQMTNLNKLLNVTDGSNIELAVNLGELIYLIGHMKKSFNDLESPAINDLWQLVTDGINDLSAIAVQLTTNFSTLLKYYDEDKQLLSDSIKLFNLVFNSTDEINHVLEVAAPVLMSLRHSIADINSNLTNIDVNHKGAEYAFRNVSHHAEKLHRLLKETAKYNFMTENTPNLRQLYQNVSMSLKSAVNTINTVRKQLTFSQGQLNHTSDLLHQHVSLNISLSKLLEFNKLKKSDIELLSENIKEVNDSFTILDLSLINTTNTNTNHTLYIIKMMYRNSSDALIAMQNTLKMVDVQITDISHAILDRNNYMTDIEIAVDDYQQLQTMKNETDSHFGLVNNDLLLSTENAKLLQTLDDDISNVLSAIKQRFLHVNNSYLHEDLEQLSNKSIHTSTKINQLLNELILLQNISNQTLNSITGTHDSMNVQIDTLANLAMVISYNKLNLENVNSNISETNSMLTNLTPNLLSLDNKTAVLLQRANHLKNLFLEEEKKMYIEEVVPKLSVKFNGLQKLLNDTHDAISMTNSHLLDTHALIYNISNTINDKSYVDINLDNKTTMMGQTSKIIDSADNSLAYLTEVSLNLDTELLLANDTTLNNNDTIDVIRRNYERFNNTVQSITHNLTGLNFEIQTAASGLADIHEFARKIVEHLDKLDILVLSTSELDTQLHDMDVLTQFTANSSIIIADTLVEIENRIADIQMKIGKVNNAGLIRDLHTLNDSVRVYRKEYDALVDNVSKSITDMSDLKDNNRLIINVLSKTSKSEGDLSRKVNDVSSSYVQLFKHANIFQPRIVNISSEMNATMQTVENVITTVNELEERFKQQQIVDYIQNRFPDVLQQYILINETTDTYDNDIEFTYAALNELFSRTIDVNYTIIKHPEIELSIDVIYTELQTMASHLENISKIHDEMKTMFEGLSNEISNSFNENETLSDIRTRFRKYNNSINSILSTYEELKQPLEMLRLNIPNYNGTVANYNTEIARYDNVSNLNKGLASIIDSSNDSLENAMRISEYIDDVLSNTTKQIHKMQYTYDTVNSTSLHTKMNNIMHSLTNENSSFTTKLNVLKTLNVTYSNVTNQRHKIVHLLSGPIPTYNELYSINRHTHNMSKMLANKTEILNSGVDILQVGLTEQRDSLRHLSNEVEQLERDFREKQKMDFIDNNVPRVKGMYNKVKRNINQTLTTLLAFERRSDLFNTSVNTLSNSINVIPNVNISVEAFEEYNVIFITGADELFSILTEFTRAFNNLNISIFNKTYLQNETMRFVFETFNNTLDKLQEVDTHLDYINFNVSYMSKSLSDMEKEHSNIVNILQEFMDTASEYSRVYNTYQELDSKLARTTSLLENIKKIVGTQQNMFEELRNTYNKTSNSYIQSNISKFSDLIEYVVIRYPLVKKLYNSRLMNKYALTKTLLYDADELLNSNYSMADVLNNTLVDISAKLLNVSQEEVVMAGTLFHYEDEGTQLHDILEETKDILTHLAALFKEEQKRHFMKTNIPLIQQRYDQMFVSMTNVSVLQKHSNKLLPPVKSFLDYIDASLSELPTLNISTNGLRVSLDRYDDELIMISNVNNDTTSVLDSINLDLIMNIEIPLNTSISYNELQSRFNTVDSVLTQAEMTMHNLNNNAYMLNRNMSDSESTLSFINDTLNLFRAVRDKAEKLSDQLNSVNMSRQLVDDKLGHAEIYLKEINNTINRVKEKYNAYEYNSSLTETQINDINRVIANLTISFLRATDEFELSKELVKNINTTLYLPEETIQSLNKTIHTVKTETSSAMKLIEHVNITFNSILRDLPSVSVSLDIIDMDVQGINSTLINEHNKTILKNNTLPLLEEKHRRINVTFEMTNLTLGHIHEQIEELNAYVTRMKNRLDTFPTINISLTDIDDNITMMEKRLEIMRDYYKNVQEIVTTFQTKLAANNIFGNNISFTDVESQYNAFNNTLDMVDTVLSKLDNDFTKMDDHFNYINDTLGDVDEALNTFEKKDIRIQSLTKDLLGINYSTIKTNQSVAELVSNMDLMSDRFRHLQNKYSNVTDKSFNENAAIEQQIASVNETLQMIDETVRKLLLQHDETTNELTVMNATLFQKLNTIDDLSSALINVKGTYRHIKRALANLTSAGSEANEIMDSVKYSLSEISQSLHKFNNTLHTEQQKFTFVNRNIGSLEAKYNELLVPFSETKSTISVVGGGLKLVDSNIISLIEKLQSYPTVNISNSGKIGNVKRMKKLVDYVTSQYKTMQKVFSRIGENLTNLTDRSGDLSEIQSNFSIVNDTLDTIKENITDILYTLQQIGSNTSDLQENVSLLNSSLDDFSTTNDNFSSVSKNVTFLGEEIQKGSSVVQRINDRVGRLDTDIQNMKTYYKHVTEPTLQNKLTESIERLKNESHNVIRLSTKIDNEEQRHTEIYMNSADMKDLLNRTLNSHDELSLIIHKTNNVTTGIVKSSGQIYEKMSLLNENATIIQKRVNEFENELQQLNMSLFEEKAKQDFINDNFPKLENQFNELNETFISTGTTVRGIQVEMGVVIAGMNVIQNRLNNIETVHVSLDAENKTTKEINFELQDLTSQLYIISDIINTFNIESLNSTNGSFSDVRKTYSALTNTILNMEHLLNDVTNRIWKVNSKISPLQKTFIEVNKTIDRFLDVENVVSSVMHDAERSRTENYNITSIVRDIINRFDSYNMSFHDVLTNYSHISDNDVVGVRDRLINNLKDIKQNINSLNNSILEVRKLADSAINELLNISMAFNVNTSELDIVMEYTNDVNDTVGNVQQRLYEIDKKHNDIHNTSNHLSPEIELLLKHINNLTAKFIDEQKKLDFIADNKFELFSMSGNLSGTINSTQIRIAATDLTLKGLVSNITKIGDRLNKFKILPITTAKELDIWQSLHDIQLNLTAKFMAISGRHHFLQNDMAILNDRNNSYDEIRSKYAELHTKLNGMQTDMTTINDKLDSTDIEILQTRDTLASLTNSMDRLKHIQNNARKTQKTVRKSEVKLKNILTSINDISEQIENTTNTLRTMTHKYKPLEDTSWNNKLPEFQNSISRHNKTIADANQTLNTLSNKIEIASKSITTLKWELANYELHRDNITDALEQFELTIDNNTALIASTVRPANDLDNVLLIKNRMLEELQLQLYDYNNKLKSELLKQEYVNKTRPLLQQIHLAVNASHGINSMTVDEMANVLSNSVAVINKIKEKMKIFGQDDTDGSIKEWDTAINTLLNVASAVKQQHQHVNKTLHDMLGKLWDPELKTYTDTDTLQMVQDKFADYNETLQNLKVISQNVTALIGTIEEGTTAIISQLIERDAILTTTPPTTTPSGPPEWMSFKTSEKGVIGRDKARAVCSVGDLALWNAMKIVRQGKDGRKQTIAAWMLGKGARKTVSDRRLRVLRKTEGSGGQLQVNIRSLQCKDEGTYYCSIDSHHMWPLTASIAVRTLPQDSLVPMFPTEVFEDKIANFSCTGTPGYPEGHITWKIKHDKDPDFRDYIFYSAKSAVTERDCIRREKITVQYQFDMSWNNTRIRCYIHNTDYHAEGIIRLLPYDICNKATQDGTIGHPYTPHKYIICGKELNVMQCPGATCFDAAENNCVQCKAEQGSGDPCFNKPPYSYVPHETDCKKYYICMGPNRTLKRCSRGYFHPHVPGFCTLSYSRSWCSRPAP